MKTKKFIFLEHTADVKFQAFGKNLNEVFENSALALKEVMTKGIKIKTKEKRKIKIEAKDRESLLLNFLEEFLYLLDAENFILSRIKKVKIKNNELEADIIGDKAENYKFSNDVKAITYNEMFVKKEGNKFITQVVLDV